jgi:hypothetical protein
MLNNRPNFSGSDVAYANSLGIHKSAYSQLKKGVTEKVLSEPKWISIARRLNVTIGNEPEWVTAATPVYLYITKQLEYCQRESTTGIFCDKADIGKSHTAKEYVRRHKSAVYIDCSLVKSKQKLVRAIAKEFGIDHTGKYSDVFEDLVYYLKAIPTPIIILDEAGDLDYAAFLELKALWNATENHCAWYMMGADGLEAKMERGIANRKVGFTEIFTRYGARYQKAIPKGTDERVAFMRKQSALIIQANYPNAKEIDTLLTKTNGSLRRVRKEVIKLKRQSQLN